MTKLGEAIEIYEVEPASMPVLSPKELEEDGEDTRRHERSAPVETPSKKEGVPV